MKLFTNALKQLQDRELRIEDQRCVNVLGQLAEQCAADGGLSGTDLPGKLHETAALAEAIKQVSQRFAVVRAHIHETRIGDDGERRLREPEVGAVQARHDRREQA